MDARLHAPLCREKYCTTILLKGYSGNEEQVVFDGMPTTVHGDTIVSVFIDSMVGEVFVRLQGDSTNDGLYVVDSNCMFKLRDSSYPYENGYNGLHNLANDESLVQLLNKYQSVNFPAGIPAHEFVRLLHLSHVSTDELCIALTDLV